jgi:hypothetical protein
VEHNTTVKLNTCFFLKSVEKQAEVQGFHAPRLQLRTYTDWDLMYIAF